MGDLTKIKNSSAVGITGGDESNIADVTSQNELKTSDVLRGGNGLQANIVVGTVAVEAKVGVSKLVDREFVWFMALDKGVYYGANSGVTTANGIPAFKNQLIMVPKGSSLWLVADAVSKNVRIIEED